MAIIKVRTEPMDIFLYTGADEDRMRKANDLPQSDDDQGIFCTIDENELNWADVEDLEYDMAKV